MPCISALFPTVELFHVLWMHVQPAPQVVTLSDSYVRLMVGGLVISGLCCRELEGCSDVILGTQGFLLQ